MDTLHKIEHWADAHHPLWLDFLRIALGVYLVVKGTIFISDNQALMQMIKGADIFMASMLIVHYVTFAHIIGGVFIAVGLLTRFAVLIQIPILLGAVFLINPQGFFVFDYNLEFWSSVVVLFLLIVFLVYGPGRISVVGYKKRKAVNEL